MSMPPRVTTRFLLTSLVQPSKEQFLLGELKGGLRAALFLFPQRSEKLAPSQPDSLRDILGILPSGMRQPQYLTRFLLLPTMCHAQRCLRGLNVRDVLENYSPWADHRDTSARNQRTPQSRKQRKGATAQSLGFPLRPCVLASLRLFPDPVHPTGIPGFHSGHQKSGSFSGTLHPGRVAKTDASLSSPQAASVLRLCSLYRLHPWHGSCLLLSCRVAAYKNMPIWRSFL